MAPPMRDAAPAADGPPLLQRRVTAYSHAFTAAGTSTECTVTDPAAALRNARPNNWALRGPGAGPVPPELAHLDDFLEYLYGQDPSLTRGSARPGPIGRSATGLRIHRESYSSWDAAGLAGRPGLEQAEGTALLLRRGSLALVLLVMTCWAHDSQAAARCRSPLHAAASDPLSRLGALPSPPGVPPPPPPPPHQAVGLFDSACVLRCAVGDEERHSETQDASPHARSRLS